MTKTQEVHPKEFIGTLQQVDETPKQYIGQLKSEENETKEKVTSEEETDDESIHHGQESPDAIEFNDFDGKDIDIDENSKIFLKNMLLSNVETCDIDDLENGDISGSTSDKGIKHLKNLSLSLKVFDITFNTCGHIIYIKKGME